MSKPPPNRNTWADPAGDFTITPARSGEVLPAPEPTTPLDELIRAFDDGNGADIQEHLEEIRARLVELRRYREILRCSKCGRTVLGRSPVCEPCHNLPFEVSEP